MIVNKHVLLNLFLFLFLCTGAPIVVSFPHFYQADEEYINAIEGMNPNEEEHETYLDINPVCSDVLDLFHCGFVNG